MGRLIEEGGTSSVQAILDLLEQSKEIPDLRERSLLAVVTYFSSAQGQEELLSMSTNEICQLRNGLLSYVHDKSVIQEKLVSFVIQLTILI